MEDISIVYFYGDKQGKRKERGVYEAYISLFASLKCVQNAK